MKPGIIGLIKRTNSLAIGTTKTIKIVAFLRLDIPLIDTRII